MTEQGDAATDGAHGTQTSPCAGEMQRQRDALMLLRDHLEQLLCTLLYAMPRADVESLLAGCGSSELIQFGREAVTATVVTAFLQRPGIWKGAREAVRRGCRRGHARGCDSKAQDEAAALTEQLLDRLEFGLGEYRRRRASLDSALQQAERNAARAKPQGAQRTRGLHSSTEAGGGTR